MGLSDQIPFAHFSGPLGEDVFPNGPDGDSVRAIPTFHDDISTMGRQYQYLMLEVDSEVNWVPETQRVYFRGEWWKVTQKMRSTYTGSVKYKCSDV